MVFDEFDGAVKIDTMVTNDDSKMRSNSTHSDNGDKLLNTTPEPRFLCDPGHRIETMSKKIFEMVRTNKDPNTIKYIDSLRVKKTFPVTFISLDQETLKPSMIIPLHQSSICLTTTSFVVLCGVG